MSSIVERHIGFVPEEEVTGVVEPDNKDISAILRDAALSAIPSNDSYNISTGAKLDFEIAEISRVNESMESYFSNTESNFIIRCRNKCFKVTVVEFPLGKEDDKRMED